MKDKDFKAYANEIEAAHDLYDTIVKNNCYGAYGLMPLSPEEAYKLLKMAGAKKAQFIGAAGKRLRLKVALDLLAVMDKKVDMTSTLARKITTALLGRAIENRHLSRYATPGRTAANKSADLSRFEELTDSEDFKTAVLKLAEVLERADKIRETVAELRMMSPAAGRSGEIIKEAIALYKKQK